MACRESSIDFLRQLGYTPIQLPRERIRPLDLVGKLSGGGRAKQLGSLTKLVVGTVEPPEILRDETVGQVSGKKTDKLDIGVGLNLLSKFFSALGVVSAALGAAFNKARQVEFHYEEVMSDSVDIVDLRGYLGKRPSLDHNNPVVDDYFIGDGQVVVITRTLKSNGFGVEATDERGNKVDINVDILKDDLVKAGVNSSRGTETKVSFKGAKHLVFAFQGLLLRIDTGGLRVADDIPPEFGIFASQASRSGEPTPVLLSRNGLLGLD
ncbi:MAG: gasdermin [Armatimonadota bacterium]